MRMVLPSGIPGGKEFLDDGLADDGDLGGLADVLVCRTLHPPSAAIGGFGRYSGDSPMTLVFQFDRRQYLCAVAVFGADGGHALNWVWMASASSTVRLCPLPQPRAHRPGLNCRRKSTAYSRPGWRSALHLLLGAAGDADRGDDGADADDHAQHRQQRSAFCSGATRARRSGARQKFSCGQFDACWACRKLLQFLFTAIQPVATASSVTILPSRKMTMRLV